MEVYININGVLRNLIQKFEYHYGDAFAEIEEKEGVEPFDYGINYPIDNEDLKKSFKFSSSEEFNFFTYVEYPIEIFGHAGVSYPTAVSDLNNLIFENKEHNFTLIGVDELGKSKPATLFFLSKNGFLGDNIRFIKSEDIKTEWKKCDLWVTDSSLIVKNKPRNKKCIFFETDYNKDKKINKKINKITDLKQLKELW